MRVFFIHSLRTLCPDLYTANSRTTKSSKKPATTKRLKLSKASLHNVDVGDDSDNRPTTPELAQRKLTKSSPKLSPTQTDGESDDLAIEKKKVPKKVDKGKIRAKESPPETFESAGTDQEDPHPGLSSVKPHSAKGKSLRDTPPNVQETITAPITPRGDVSEEEKEQKPPPRKRGRPREDGVEKPPPKKRKTQKANDGEVKGSAKSKSKRQAKKSSPMPKSTVIKSRTKKADTPPDMSDVEKEEYISPENETSGSNTRKRQRRTLDDESSDEKEDEPPDDDEPNQNPGRVRLDSIPPEGVVIRKKNGIVERLLPPVMYVQFHCLLLPAPNLHIAVNLRGRPRVIGGRPGVLVNGLFPLMF